MSELPEEERRYYSLKPKAFERVNAPKDEEGDDPNEVRSRLHENLDRDDEARTQAPFPAKRQSQAKEGDPNDAYTVLNENLVKHKASAKPLDLTKPRSLRRREYILSMIGGNTVFLAALALYWGNIVVMIFALSGAVMFSAGLTWIFWAVMSDYD